jgi:hypothetical protein
MSKRMGSPSPTPNPTVAGVAVAVGAVCGGIAVCVLALAFCERRDRWGGFAVIFLWANRCGRGCGEGAAGLKEGRLGGIPAVGRGCIFGMLGAAGARS